jgi:hypothetical protein
MPHDSSAGFNSDMPSIWLLNAQIPRTLQYGNPECSCWVSGCGEFDIAESLNAGSEYLKSTVHTDHPGGDSNYFKRPTSGTTKLAVIFSSEASSIRLQVLPADYKFPTTLNTDAIDKITKMNSGKGFSRFTII